MASHRFKLVPATRRVDLTAEPRDIDVHHIGERILAIAPNLVDAGAREHAARRAHQQFENGKLLGGKLDLLAAALDFKQVPVQSTRSAT